MKREDGCSHFHSYLCASREACPARCERKAGFDDFFRMDPAVTSHPRGPVTAEEIAAEAGA